MNQQPIAVFDSGVGGLTVARELIATLPGEDLIYLGDTARVPYGPRELEEVRGFVLEIVEFLGRENVKLIVIACNAGTAAGLGQAQGQAAVPVVGVVEPGARAAAKATRTGHVGVIASELTVDSGSYQRALRNLSPGLTVHCVACPPFVDFVERGEIDGERVADAVRWYLEPLKRKGVDSLILGCTHYPLLREVIGEVMGPGVELISSAEETAAEARSILARERLINREGGERRFLCTGDTESFLTLGRRFLGVPIHSVERVSVAEQVMAERCSVEPVSPMEAE